MGGKRRWWWIAAGVVAVILIAVAFVPRGLEVTTAATVREPLLVTLDEEGMTRVRERFVVSAPVAGKVLRIDLDPGDPVVAGVTVLATFAPSDPVPLDARSRAESEAALAASEASLGRARSLQHQASQELEFSRSETERYRRLSQEGIVPEERLREIELRMEMRQEALAGANFAVRSAEGDLQAARARVSRASFDADRGEIVEITSPIDGTVLGVYRESEAVVPAGEALVEVGDARRLEVVADYLSSDAVRIDTGDPATIERWGGEPLRAVVRRVEPSGFTKISALGVEEQRVNVVLDLTEPPAGASLGDGYRVETRVVVWSGDEVLQVPPGALFRGEDGEWAVYRVVDGRAALTTIQVGARNDRGVEIVSGIEEGEQVIVYPGDGVDDGVRVRPGDES